MPKKHKALRRKRRRGRKKRWTCSRPRKDSLLDETFKPRKFRKPRLPIAFDMQCRECQDGTRLEISRAVVCISRKPFATLQCPKCYSYLYLFGTREDPLVVTGNRFKGSTTFSEDIEELFRLRDLDRKRRRLRHRKAHKKTRRNKKIQKRKKRRPP